MAIINCKNCGGNIALSEDRTFGTCDFCGSTMTFPKVSDEQRAAAFNRGNHFRRIGEFDKALAVYERIVQEDDHDAEAHWCCALCRFGIEYVEDPVTFEWLPTCHRASFDSFLEDVDYLAALEHSEGLTQRQYRKDAAKIAEVQRGILATSQNAEAYDVFICYKESDAEGQRTRDSLMAQDIYYQLTEQGKRVFFARITLEDVAGTQYEPYIFAALNSAKVMVVVGTKPEHFSAVWVKNEWSRFLAMMRKDRTKLLLPCYAGMDPYDLPEQLSVLQSYDMTKIGFIQDLIRGIGKVLDADKKPEAVAPTPAAVQPTAQQSSNVTALLKRGAMALEDGDWSRADEFYEEVLNQDAECGEAYLGKFLVQQRQPDLAALANVRIDAHSPETVEHILAPDPLDIRKYISQYLIPDYLTDMELRPLYAGRTTYTTCAAGWRKLKVTEEAFWSSQKDLNRAIRFASAPLSGQITATRDRVLQELDQKIAQAEQQDIDNETDAKQRLEEMRQKADKAAQSLHDQRAAQRDAYYEDLVEKIGSAHISRLAELMKSFQKLGSYRDSEKMVVRCQERRNELTALLNAQAEARRREEYDAMVSEIETADKARLVTLEQMFLSYKDYLDSPGMAKRCDERRKELIHQDFLKEEAAKNARKRRKRRRTAITLLIIAAIAILTVLTVKIFIPANHYKAAEAALEAGDFTEAAMLFSKAGEYRDSWERSMALWDQIAARDTVSAGDYHTVGLRADGTVIAAGDNDDGQCDVGGWTDIVAVSAVNRHTVGLKADGTAVAVGFNEYGQCDVSGWTDIVAVSVGNYHTVGLKADGTVTAVGFNEYGQCDVSGWTDIVAVSTGWHHTVGLKADGTVVAVGYNYAGECNVSGWTDIVAISAGNDHTVGLKADGTVVVVGSNILGQCNVSSWTDIVAISAGKNHTVGLKADGTVVVVGSNKYGKCDVEDWTDIVAVSAGGSHTVGLKADGTVVAVGDNYTNEDYKGGRCDVEGWTDIVAICAGGNHTVGLKADGTVVAVGSNRNGQCDVGGWAGIRVPIK